MNGRAHGLGRLQATDPQDRKHLMPRRTRQAAAVTRRFWHCWGILDQGSTPQCVGYAVWNWLASGPVINTPKFTPTWLYQEAQKEDEWPGEDYEGTSGRGAFKVLKRESYIGEYLWAFDCATILEHLLTVGPVVVGTNWYWSMDKVDKKGFIKIDGAIAGGHQYLLIGADREKKTPDGNGAIRMVQSWGLSWGQRGRAWLTLPQVDRLIKEEGDASIAIEIKHAMFSDVETMFA